MKRGSQHEKSLLSYLAATEWPCRRQASADRRPLPLHGVSVHHGRFAAAVSVYSRLGLGCADGCGADLRRLGSYIKLQEVMDVKVRMVCVRLPRCLSGVVRFLARRRA